MSKCYDNPDYDDSESDIQNTWNQHPKVEKKHEAKNKEKVKAINKKWWAENKEYRQLKKLL